MSESKQPERRGVWAAKRVAAYRAGRKVTVRLTGVRRIPTSLAGGAIGFGVIIYFFVELNRMSGGSPVRFLGMLSLLGIVTAFAVWALVVSPIRSTFDQRWRPHRRVAPLDTEAWTALADTIGGRFVVMRGLPRIIVGYRGVAARLEFIRVGGARTVGSASLPFRLEGRLTVRPRRAVFRAKAERRTGDPEFDAEFRVESEDPSLVNVLTAEVRSWVRAVYPEAVHVSGRSVEAHRIGFVSEPDLVRGILEIAVAVARSR